MAWLRKTVYKITPLRYVRFYPNSFFSLILILLAGQGFAQCIIQSSSGYQVEVYPTPEAVLAPNECPWGYNYNVEIDYSVSITGENAPASLYTLQGNLHCGNKQLFFDLPNNGGTGKTVTVSNPWNSNSDCGTATLNDLDCHDIKLQVQGPGISWQVIDCNWSPLPIELVAFHVIEWRDRVRLVWTTASETNNQYFSIERSADARNWSEVVRVAGAGNSTSPIDYEAIDPEPLPGVSYYRLKQTDFDGKYSMSNIKSTTFSDLNQNEIKVYPNPTDGIITISAPASQMESFAAFDVQGGDVTSQIIWVQKGTNQSVIDLGQLQSGVYTLMIGSGIHRVYLGN